jgi:hypothetical protein
MHRFVAIHASRSCSKEAIDGPSTPYVTFPSKPSATRHLACGIVGYHQLTRSDEGLPGRSQVGENPWLRTKRQKVQILPGAPLTATLRFYSNPTAIGEGEGESA